MAFVCSPDHPVLTVAHESFFTDQLGHIIFGSLLKLTSLRKSGTFIFWLEEISILMGKVCPY